MPTSHRVFNMVWQLACRPLVAMSVGLIVPLLLVADSASKHHPAETTRDGLSAHDVIARDLLEFDIVESSIGEEIDAAEVIAVATVVEIDEPRWNSHDGHNWNAEFDADPTAYQTVPMPFTTVTLRLDELLSEKASEAPSVVGTELLEVEFRADAELDQVEASDVDAPETVNPSEVGIGVGDQRIFFLRWSQFPFPTGEMTYTWQGDTDAGLWNLLDSYVYPQQGPHILSLRAAAMLGEATLVQFNGTPPALALEDLKRLIEAERRSPDVATVAGYDRWPWQSVYRSDVNRTPPHGH